MLGASELLDLVNNCQIDQMEKAGKELDPAHQEACTKFSLHVKNVEAAMIHTYQLTAFAALHEQNPELAAKLWQQMTAFCDRAITALKTLKEKHPWCGAPKLYDLALDYRSESQKRYYQNLQDAECAKTLAPEGLFPKTS